MITASSKAQYSDTAKNCPYLPVVCSLCLYSNIMSGTGSSGDGEFSILLLLQPRSRVEYCQKLHSL